MRHTPVSALFPYACCCFRKTRDDDGEMMPLVNNDDLTERSMLEVDEQMDKNLNKIIK